MQFAASFSAQVAYGASFVTRLKVAHGGPGTGSGMRIRAVRTPQDGSDACSQSAVPGLGFHCAGGGFACAGSARARMQ